VLAFALSRQGGPFTPHLFATSPAILLTSEAGTPPDVAELFYNSDKDTRLVGLVDGNTGKLRWQAEPLSGDGYADALAQSTDLLYAASGTYLLAYRKNDGSLAWQAEMPDKLNYGEGSLLVTDGRVLTLNLDQSVQAYDAQTGALAWSRRLAGYDRTLRLMGGSLVLLDYTGDDYTYSLVFLDPLTGAEQNIITPACPYSEYSSATLDTDSGLVYDQVENALYLVFDSSSGCIQRLDLASGQTTWQTVAEDSFSFSSYGLSALNTDTILFFSNESQLLAVDKATGALQTLLTDEDYEFIPLAVTGDRLIVRARRTRGSERFELWGLKAASGERLWRMDLENAKPIDPPNELVGLVDKDESGWIWNLLAGPFVLIQFQAAPNQLVIQTVNPADGTLTSKTSVALKAVTGDFYSVPTVIGWQDNLLYISLETNIYALDVSTGKVKFSY
jgi:outer membrane protein assembly factor BamB